MRRGSFVMHDNAIPDLTAGRYVLHVEHRIDVPGEAADPIPARDAQIEVTAPRYVMPPDQILSTFPPNQAQGAFSSRLPQIVLRRRTLPWERRHPGMLKRVPWLALVVLADGEGEIVPDVPVAQCVSDGCVLDGDADATTATALRVTEKVVHDVFPGRDEVDLLAHVREVDLDDTELGLGDDDGFMAVVVANRLPQPGVRYRACLISIEGQIDLLPRGRDAEVAYTLQETHVYPDVAAHIARGDLDALRNAARAGAARLDVTRSAAKKGFSPADSWSAAPRARGPALSFGGLSIQRRFEPLQPLGVPLEAIHPEEKILVFPVLAQWTFTCGDSGDFGSRMRGLNVALADSAPPPPPPPPPAGEASKSPPPATRPPLELLATGHVALDAVTREGVAERVWYRGPLSPRPGTRTEPDAAGRVPILHVSDQARRIGSDGREDASLAIAFEIGRLLALADPAMVAALVRWRRTEFSLGRTGALVAGDARLSRFVADGLDRLAVLAGRDLLAGFGRDPRVRLGPTRPPVDPGMPFLPDGDVLPLIESAFGVQIDAPDAAPPDVLLSSDAAVLVGRGVGELGHLADALARERDLLVESADELRPRGRP